MEDLVFYGGMIGATLGNQQCTLRNMLFHNCQQAVNQAFDWGMQSTPLSTFFHAFLHIGFPPPDNSIRRHGKYAWNSADSHMLTASRLDIYIHQHQQLPSRLKSDLRRPLKPDPRLRNLHRQQH